VRAFRFFYRGQCPLAVNDDIGTALQGRHDHFGSGQRWQMAVRFGDSDARCICGDIGSMASTKSLIGSRHYSEDSPNWCFPSG
jgi:hypothetical protein